MPDEKVETISPEKTLEERETFSSEVLEDEKIDETQPDKKVSTGEPPEKIESKEKTDKKEEVKEEELELPKSTIYERPTYKEITSKYPDFFKEFPTARHVFFREAEFTNLFGDVDTAKEAAEKSKDYEFFEEKLTSGDPKDLLNALKESDSLSEFAANFLPSLREAS